MLGPAQASLVVCGHTHRQFDMSAGGARMVNAGSVGRPYEHEPGAYWLWLSGEDEGTVPSVSLRRTEYDVEAATAAFAALGYPTAEAMLAPVDADALARNYEATADNAGRAGIAHLSAARAARSADGAVAPAEEHGVDQQREELEERDARLVPGRERVRLRVGGEEPRVGRAEEAQHREVDLAVAAVGGGVDHAGRAEHVPRPEVAVHAARAARPARTATACAR